MNKLIVLVICTLMVGMGCSQKSAGNDMNELRIEITLNGQHPLLIDHKKSATLLKGDTIIETQELFLDPGNGSPVHVVYGEERITMIDSNGEWYQISDYGIRRIGWKWMEALPEGEVVIYEYMNGTYKSRAVDVVETEDVYRYKDPNG